MQDWLIAGMQGEDGAGRGEDCDGGGWGLRDGVGVASVRPGQQAAVEFEPGEGGLFW